MNIDALQTLLLSLLRGRFSSLSISYNESPAMNYETVEQYLSRNDDDIEDWVSPEERALAIAGNGLWEAHWYPDTPVGFCVLRASSLTALITALQEFTE